MREKDGRNQSTYLNSKDEWVYPQIYYRGHKKITKKQLLDELCTNQLVQEAVQIEPRLGQLIEQAKQPECVYGYCANKTFYEHYKPQIVRFVGWESPHQELRTQEQYNAVYDAVYELFPADEVDLYPDGIMPNGMFCPSLQKKYGQAYP